MSRKIVSSLMLLFVLPFLGYGQTVYELEDAISYALKNSSVIEKAKLEIERGQQVISETRASAFPQLNLNSSVTINPIVQQFVLPAEALGGNPGEYLAIRAGQDWTAMTQVQLSQQVFNKQLFAGIKAAKGSLEYYQLLKDLSEQNIIQQVAVNYYMVIINREKLHVIQSNIERIQQLEDIVRRQFEVGLAKKIDLDRITVNKSNQVALSVDLERVLSQQENLLKYYMGMPIDTEISLPEFSVEKLESSLRLDLLNDSYQLEDLIDFKVLEKQKELLGYEREAFKAEYFPSLFLDANYIYNTQSDKFNLYSSNALNYDMSSISLRINVPIFDGFARRSRIKQNAISLRKIDEEIKDTSNSLSMMNENAKKLVTSAQTNIVNQKATKDLALEVFHSTQNNYRNGLASLTDLLNAETELVAAQNSYNEALLNFKIAEIDLVKSQGNIKSLMN